MKKNSLRGMKEDADLAEGIASDEEEDVQRATKRASDTQVTAERLHKTVDDRKKARIELGSGDVTSSAGVTDLSSITMDEENHENENENENQHEDELEDTEKKAYREPKKRMKRFYNSIRQQIEFYLGDVNLCRDRFFANLMQESPYIDIDVILRCNKIRKLTENPKDIVQALAKSTLISVTEDGQKIFRKVPVTPITNADESTIYVEDLPLETTHDTLKTVFGRYGKIEYVSIPHYRTSRKLKGFAFIQFDTPESAEKALEAFRSANSCLFNTMEPKELLSIKTFEGEKDRVVRPRGGFDADQLMSVDNCEESDSRTEDEAPSGRRRKRRITVESAEKSDQEKSVEKPEESDTRTEDGAPCTKKRKRKSETESAETKTEQQQQKKMETTESQTSSKKKKKNTKSDAEPTASEASEADETEKEGDQKPTHRRRRKKAKKNEPVQTFGMQIISKNDWKKLRNKYLEEQRFRMTELKLQLQQAQETCEVEEEENFEEEPAPEEIKTAEARVKFTPGVIVRLPLDQPIQNVKRFKNEVKRYAEVEYIDADENSYSAYFRCASNEIANQVIGLNKWPNMYILKGDEEQAYWEKIKNDRKQKYEGKIRCLTRGKNKLMKKVEAAASRNHIRFAD